MRFGIIGLGALLVAVGLGLGVTRVAELESEELEAFSPEWVTLEGTTNDEGVVEPHVELVRAELREGENVMFEVCSEGALDPDVWVGAMELFVFHVGDQEIARRVPLDAEHLDLVLRSSRGACLVLGRSPTLPVGGEYSIEAVWAGRELTEAQRSTAFRGRIVAHRTLVPSDRYPVLAILLGALLLIIACTRWREPGLPPTPAVSTGGAAEPTPRRPGTAGVLVRLGLGMAALLGGFVLTAVVSLPGSTGSLVGGLAIATIEILAAVLLVSAARAADEGGRTFVLGLVRPRQAMWLLLAAPVAGLLLWFAGRFALLLVPSTAEAPIEALASFPSGMFAFALIGVAVPVAEEIFFRGFVFGSIEARWGGPAAFGVTVVVFALAHAPQGWGAWGALTGILVTGVGLTLLRWWTGSTLVTAIAHLAHNGIIVVWSLWLSTAVPTP